MRVRKSWKQRKHALTSGSAGGIDNHKVRGDKEHGPQAAGVRVRSVPAAIGSQHALASSARDFALLLTVRISSNQSKFPGLPGEPTENH